MEPITSPCISLPGLLADADFSRYTRLAEDAELVESVAVSLATAPRRLALSHNRVECAVVVQPFAARRRRPRPAAAARA